MTNIIRALRRPMLNIFHSRFVRNVAVMVTGTAGAQAIALIFAPILTRLYGPEAFGEAGSFIAVVMVFSPIAALAYPTAIVLSTNDEEAYSLVRLSIALSVFTSLVIGITLWLPARSLLPLLSPNTSLDNYFLIPLATMLTAWIQTAQQWLIRKSDFNLIARVEIIQSAVTNLAKSGAGLLHPAGMTLIFLSILSYALNVILLLKNKNVKSKINAATRSKKKRFSLSIIAYQYRDFPLYRAPQNFINAASQSLPLLMLTALFGPISAGYYALSRTVMGVPSILVGRAFTSVFYQRISLSIKNNEDLPKQIRDSTTVLLLLGIVPFGSVAAFGPEIFRFIFGDEWYLAGDYARWLSIFFLFNLINKPCVAAVPVLRIQRGLLVYEILSTGSKALGLIAGFYWFSSEIWAVALFSTIGAVAYIAMMLWIYRSAVKWKNHAEAS